MKRVLSTAGTALVIGTSMLAGTAGASVTPATVTPNVKVNPPRDPAKPTQDFRSPVIAINPTNANNMVMVARTDEPDYFCRVYYSFDRGASWTPATGNGASFPDPPTGTCWSPGVAFDAAGNVYVVAQNRPVNGGSPTTVVIWKSTNGGQKFGAPLTIPDSARFGAQSFSVQADVAIDTSPSSPYFGRIYVTWHEFPGSTIDAVLTYSDNGVNWSPVIKRPIPGTSQQLPDLTVAPDGTVYDIFKTGSAFGSGGTACRGIGGFFGGPGPVTGTDCPVQILRSSNGGASFDADPFTVGTTFFPGGDENANVKTAVAEEPSLVVTPSGTLLVAVATYPNPPAAGCAASLQAVVYRSTNRGQTWSGPNTVNDDSCASGNEHRDPRLSVAPNGRVDVAFYDDRFDTHSHIPANPATTLLYDVEYANSTDDGLTFGPNTRLSDTSFDGTKLFAIRPAGSPPNGFQTRDYDTVTGLASLNDLVIAAWGDTRLGGAADLFSARILGFLPPGTPPAGSAPPAETPAGSSSPPSFGPDGSDQPPLLILGGPDVQRLGSLYVSVLSNKDVAVGAGGTITPPRTNAARTYRLRSTSANAPARTTVKLRLKVPAKAARAIKRRLRRGRQATARITITATDKGGRKRTAQRKIKVVR